MIQHCIHEIVQNVLIFDDHQCQLPLKDRQKDRNKDLKQHLPIRPYSVEETSIHQVASIRTYLGSTSNSRRPCHQFFQNQDRRGIHFQDDLEETDEHQLHSRAMYMGIAIPYNANSWI